MNDGGSLVPRWLEVLAAWAWRLLVIGAVGFLVVRELVVIKLVVLAFVGALFVTTVLEPPHRWLAARMPRLAATWIVILAAIGVFVGAAFGIGYQASQQASTLADQIADTARDLLSGPPFNLSGNDVNDLLDRGVDLIRRNSRELVTTVLSGLGVVGEVISGIILAVFIAFFLVNDGNRIWSLVLRPVAPAVAPRVDAAGRAGWKALAGFVRGTSIIALFHTLVMSVSLLLLGVPLVAALAVLVFVSAFLPLIGIVIAGGLAVLVTFGSAGWVSALVLLVIIVVSQQAEGHLLQPVVMSRSVCLPPLAIGLVIAIGTILGGIAGALVAVPTTAVIYNGWRGAVEYQPPDESDDSDESKGVDNGPRPSA